MTIRSLLSRMVLLLLPFLLAPDGRAQLNVVGLQKISEQEGGFSGDLDINDWFGRATEGLGDLDGDGTV